MDKSKKLKMIGKMLSGGESCSTGTCGKCKSCRTMEDGYVAKNEFTKKRRKMIMDKMKSRKRDS